MAASATRTKEVPGRGLAWVNPWVWTAPTLLLVSLACGMAWGADPQTVRIGVTKIVFHAALDADEKRF